MNSFKFTLTKCAALIALVAIAPLCMAEQRIVRVYWDDYVQSQTPAKFFVIDWESGDSRGSERIDDINAGQHIFSTETDGQSITLMLSAVSQFSEAQGVPFVLDLNAPAPAAPSGVRGVYIKVTTEVTVQ